MMRRRLFIGSSGEHVHICKIIKTHLDAKCSDWLDVEIWKGSGVFTLNEGTLGMLMNDKQLYLNLTKTIGDLDSLMIDLKAHPKRYVHFSVF